MKRKIEDLTKWEDFEKELLKNKRFARLAKKAKTKQPVISRIETAAVKPSISLLERLATALDSTLEIKFLS